MRDSVAVNLDVKIKISILSEESICFVKEIVTFDSEIEKNGDSFLVKFEILGTRPFRVSAVNEERHLEGFHHRRPYPDTKIVVWNIGGYSLPLDSMRGEFLRVRYNVQIDHHENP